MNDVVKRNKAFSPARLGLAAALAAVIVAVLVAGPAFAFVHDHVYPAPHARVSAEGLAPGINVITVKTADGLSLKGLEVAPRPGMPTLLVFHGNGSSAMDTTRWLSALIAEGYGMVAAEYREYSGNPGRDSEKGLAADADAFYAHARALAGGGKLIVVGHSLGGGVAFGLARRQTLDCLITIDTFTRLLDMVPVFGRPFVFDRYDNESAVAGLDEPYYLIHGTADETVPFIQGEELARAATAAHKTGAAFTIRGGRHNPDGQVVAMIIRAITAKLENGGKTVTITLPETVKVAPF